MDESGRGPAIAEFRSELHEWLDAHERELEPPYPPPGTLDDQIAQMQRVKSILFDAGWMRFGWPEAVGGLGRGGRRYPGTLEQRATEGQIEPGLAGRETRSDSVDAFIGVGAMRRKGDTRH